MHHVLWFQLQCAGVISFLHSCPAQGGPRCKGYRGFGQDTVFKWSAAGVALVFAAETANAKSYPVCMCNFLGVLPVLLTKLLDLHGQPPPSSLLMTALMPAPLLAKSFVYPTF